ncbi:hypothetical protein AB0L74_18315 [Streptomyces sp. NPDC052020]|uniref:hypothetical protein n=1 Tax=Streptomyces sp. NPDC052020 TaxID=3155677 RepID=UPI00343C647D
MTDHRLEGPGENGVPIPRDMPDQQADAGEDPWEVAPGLAARRGHTGADDESPDDDSADAAEPADAAVPDVPDTDEAGTGRQGAPHSGSVNPDHPVPDESSG